MAPIILFVYNRPVHTLLTIGALSQNNLAQASDLIVYADAPKKPAHQKSVEEVRTILEHITGFKSVNIVKRNENLGLSKSIISGVTEVLAQHGKAIILEDDMVTSPLFLSFMNEALNKYEQNEDVISIHGYNYPIQEELPSSFFLKGADCWGWATWKRGWDLFEPDGAKLRDQIVAANQVDQFNYNNHYDFMKMLNHQIEKKNDSWAVRWYASAFVQNKLTLYPGKSMVQNIGLDNSGTHSKKDAEFKHDSLNLLMPAWPQSIEHNAYSYACFCSFFADNQSVLEKMNRTFKTLFK